MPATSCEMPQKIPGCRTFVSWTGVFCQRKRAHYKEEGPEFRATADPAVVASFVTRARPAERPRLADVRRYRQERERLARPHPRVARCVVYRGRMRVL
jgi:hypothetical protein